MNSDFQLFWRFWLAAILISSANGVKIQFFRDYNYTDLIHESSSFDKCNNFPGNEQVKSFTTDSCLVQYWHSNCKSTVSRKYMPGNFSTTVGQYFPFASFHVCNEQEGGSQLNVDITEYYEKDKPADVPAVLERYRGLCTCVNIPDYIRKMDTWSVNNHANKLRVYFELDCWENKTTSGRFPAGQYDDIRNIYDWTSSGSVTKSQYHILSIGPDKNSAYYKSSCQHYILIDQLKSKVGMLHEGLQQAELKVTANQGNINNMQTAQRNEAVELIRKNQAIERKLNNVERSIEANHENVKDELVKIKRGVEMKLDDTEKIIDGKLEKLKSENTEKIGDAEGKLDDVEKRMDARYENLKHDLVGKVDGLEIELDKAEKNIEGKFEKLQNDLRRLFL